MGVYHDSAYKVKMKIICKLLLIENTSVKRILLTLGAAVDPDLLLRSLGTWEKELQKCIAAVMWVGDSSGISFRV